MLLLAALHLCVQPCNSFVMLCLKDVKLGMPLLILLLVLLLLLLQLLAELSFELGPQPILLMNMLVFKVCKVGSMISSNVF